MSSLRNRKPIRCVKAIQNALVEAQKSSKKKTEPYKQFFFWVNKKAQGMS